MRAKIQLWIAVLRSETYAHTRKSQERYKRYYVGKVQKTPLVKPNN